MTLLCILLLYEQTWDTRLWRSLSHRMSKRLTLLKLWTCWSHGMMGGSHGFGWQITLLLSSWHSKKFSLAAQSIFVTFTGSRLGVDGYEVTGVAYQKVIKRCCWVTWDLWHGHLLALPKERHRITFIEFRRVFLSNQSFLSKIKLSVIGLTTRGSPVLKWEYFTKAYCSCCNHFRNLPTVCMYS